MVGAGYFAMRGRSGIQCALLDGSLPECFWIAVKVFCKRAAGHSANNIVAGHSANNIVASSLSLKITTLLIKMTSLMSTNH